MGRRKPLNKALVVALVTGATLIPAASAHANTLTLGSQFQGTIQAAVLDGGAGTVVNTALPGPLLAGSPTDGTVIEWRISGEPDSFTPQIVRPLGGDTYTLAGTGPGQVGVGVGTIAGPFPLNLPIKQGDHFGFAGGSFSNPGVIVHDPNTGVINRYFIPPLTAGPGSTADSTGTTLEQAVNATVRYCLVPTLRGKKPKAAKKALKAADCTFGGKSKSKKRRKKKKVVGQSVAPGSSISDTAPVAIKVSRPKT